MANVNDTVRENILAFPGLFQSRADVLNFLLFTNGNGYGWAYGEPVSIFGPHEPWNRAEEEKKADERWEDLGLLGHIDRSFEIEMNDEREQVVSTVDERMKSLVLCRETVIRAEDSYTLAFRAPGDITDDWAAALVEIRKVRASF